MTALLDSVVVCAGREREEIIILFERRLAYLDEQYTIVVTTRTQGGGGGGQYLFIRQLPGRPSSSTWRSHLLLLVYSHIFFEAAP